MSQTFETPSGPPPRNPPRHQDSLEAAISDDPPPAYSTVADNNETTVQHGPTRMDFSGPPPLPDRLTQSQPQSRPPPPAQSGHMEANITGVGVGYGPRPQQNGNNSFAAPSGPPPLPHRVNGGYINGSPMQSPVGNQGNPFSDHAAAGPSRPPQQQQTDVSPTEVPTPGRPLLRNGMLLVYPKGYMCTKCNNTGFKQNDPYHPCKNDWSKYGKPYNSALQHSYTTSARPDANPSTNAASSFQRPLPNFRPPQTSHPQSNPWSHLPPPPGQGGHDQKHSWNQYPGQQHHMRPPPPMGHHQQVFVQSTPGFAPPGALVVRPGDPRIGGHPCYTCGGDGREFDFFGFSDGRCSRCGGLGRVF